jgi:hypothetical protein
MGVAFLRKVKVPPSVDFNRASLLRAHHPYPIRNTIIGHLIMAVDGYLPSITFYVRFLPTVAAEALHALPGVSTRLPAGQALLVLVLWELIGLISSAAVFMRRDVA